MAGAKGPDVNRHRIVPSCFGSTVVVWRFEIVQVAHHDPPNRRKWAQNKSNPQQLSSTVLDIPRFRHIQLYISSLVNTGGQVRGHPAPGDEDQQTAEGG